MTVELQSLERKIDLAMAKVDLMLAEVREMRSAGKPGLTQRAFAKMVGCSPRTVSRMLKDRKIRLVKNRVPHSEASKFLS